MYIWIKAPTMLLLTFGLSTMLFLIFAVVPDADFPAYSTVRFVHSVTKQAAKGHLNGHFHGRITSFNLPRLEPGDIILCHNAGGGYGYWTHAVLYVGNGYAVDSNNFSEGTKLFPLKRYINYDELQVRRANLSLGERMEIANHALKQVGTPYNPFSGLRDDRSEYCSKLIWQSYAAHDLLLCAAHTWVLPDDLANSPLLQTVHGST